MREKLQCPFCADEGEISRVYVTEGPTTLMGHQDYHDEAGDYHSHDPNKRQILFRCSRGHRWQRVKKSQCPSCDYGSEPAVINRLPDVRTTHEP